ncbi:AAA family ATPase [Erysipelothrix rhusiopathiae]|uniref:ParA family protein n=1 Tax=Erysipelothrix TaxID=1647 RepID=UPI0003609200|nr:AAA family ATPase [Erysipelothrix tonsillarum]MDE8038898.1 AAA family ATPase [Erysipelothrix rhusiopathiae]MDE8099029.1 AAA family ATPase [Erysipelothrix rhusiopathiae]MDE8127509.1 AAA family ATPase [Erysipelothrix rhusiopathiae]MDE8197303.1 AAA family ATPase [Erysipelothrix rhusiopathiae]MDE8220909.1 AAA family ATPase [Erysipelothrix rhusiopathiae]
MTKVIALLNMKGGVGKTTSSINIATGFANKGNKVLLIDLDPQANSTDILLDITQEEAFLNNDIITAIENRDTKTLDVLLEQIVSYQHKEIFIDQMLMDDSLTSTYQTKFENLHVIPSRLELANVEKSIRNGNEAMHLRLFNIIEKLKEEYDYIFIDCPPIINVLTINVINVVDEIIAPIKIDKGAEKGLLMTIRELLAIANSYRLQIPVRPLFTMVNRNNTDRDRLKAISTLDNSVIKPIPAVIRTQAKAITQSGYDNKVVINNPKFKVGGDYQEVVDYLDKEWSEK